MLTKLAQTRFRAVEIHKVPGSDTLDIDNGMNDLRAKIVGNTIEFWIRYRSQEDQYERIVLDFCKENALNLRFYPLKER